MVLNHLFYFFVFTNSFANAEPVANRLDISINKNFFLDPKSWQKGKGSFTPGGQTWNLFSNKNNLSEQVFFEDTYVPVKFANKKLPKECNFILEKRNSLEICKIKKSNNNQNELVLIARFPTENKDIIKFRTTILFTNTQNVETLFNSLLKNPQESKNK